MTNTELLCKALLIELLLDPAGPTNSQIAHREGRVRSLVYALTGKDIGYACGYYDRVKLICDWLGWGCKPCGATGWEIDWGDEPGLQSGKAPV